MFTGRPGTGKTASLVNEVWKALDKGAVIYSNFYIDWKGYEEKKTRWKRFLKTIGLKKEWKSYPQSNLRSWTTLRDIMKIQNGIVVMDEAHMYMNSRKWKDMDLEFMRKLAQHRKDGIHIWGTVQNVKRLDVVIRELIDYWYVCSIFMGFIFQVEFDIDEDQMKKHPLSQKFFYLSKKKMMRYDTLEKVGPTD